MSSPTPGNAPAPSVELKAKSVEEQLAQVQDALEAVETRGQRFIIKDRELWRANLGELDARAERLERRADREKRGGVRVQRIVPL